MAKWTVLVGTILTIVGILSASLADTGIAGLFPAFIGIPIVALGALGRINYDQRKPLLIGAIAIAALGFVRTVGDIRLGLYLISVGPVHVDHPDQVVTHSIIAIVCGAYLYGGWRWLRTPPRPQPASNL